MGDEQYGSISKHRKDIEEWQEKTATPQPSTPKPAQVSEEKPVPAVLSTADRKWLKNTREDMDRPYNNDDYQRLRHRMPGLTMEHLKGYK